jgi:hypothetical protein
MVGEQAVCASCAPYFREKKACTRCGTLSAKLSRVTGLSNEPICEACQRQVSYATCVQCKKSRKQYFCRLNREVLCKICTDHPEAAHACPDCGTVVGGLGESPCLKCAVGRNLRKKQQFLASALSSDLAVSILAEFIDWVINAGHAARASRGFATYSEFFTRIDALVVDVIDDAVLKSGFSVDELRRLGYVSQFLSDQGYLLASDADRKTWSEERRIADILNEVKSQSLGELIAQYADWLNAKTDKPLAVRTKRMYLRAAASFTDHAAVGASHLLANAHLRSFLKKAPGQRASLTSFIHFLNEQCALTLSIGSKKKKKAQSAVRDKVDRIEHLLSALHEDYPAKTKQACLAKLLNILYAIPLETILGLPPDALSMTSEGLALTVNGDLLHLDPRIAPLISYHLMDNGSSRHSNEKLFQGRNVFDALSVSAVAFHLKKLEAI